MTNIRQTIGKRGEDTACDYLLGEGHTIVARNWRWGKLEIDIITLKDNALHFVEVKTRLAPVMVSPECNVGPYKQHNLVSAAKGFLQSSHRRHLPADLEIFFDVIAIVFGEETLFEIEYYPQAFIPLYA